MGLPEEADEQQLVQSAGEWWRESSKGPREGRKSFSVEGQNINAVQIQRLYPLISFSL